MKVTPKTDKEIAESNLFPEGAYDFEIREAVDKYSNAGNEMIQLKLAIFQPDGNARYVYDYLLEIPAMEYKLKHAADACGVLDKYESGEITADDFKDKTGKAIIFIQKGKDGYADRNSVKDYVVKSKLPSASISKDLDDEIPF